MGIITRRMFLGFGYGWCWWYPARHCPSPARTDDDGPAFADGSDGNHPPRRLA